VAHWKNVLNACCTACGNIICRYQIDSGTASGQRTPIEPLMQAARRRIDARCGWRSAHRTSTAAGPHGVVQRDARAATHHS
jgi:hypothetical protein